MTNTSLLLADDSPTIAKILGMALASEPIEIRAVQTAEAAMTELHLKAPYFFLIDLMLPEINGYEFSRLVRSDENLKGVKIVLLSSAFDPIDEAEFKACGADAVIAKPFDPSELRDTLHRLQGLPVKPAAPDLEDGMDPSSLLSLDDEPAAPPATDPDSILASILDAAPAEAAPGEMPANLDLGDLAPGAERPDPTVVLDLSGREMPVAPLEEAILDLSGSFGKTPPAGTAILEVGSAPSAAPTPAPSAPAAELSPNAQALAAFFAAEVDAHQEPPSAPPAAASPAPTPAAPEEDSFDASLGSIDWGGPAEVNLNSWSAPAAKNTSAELPPPSPPSRAPAPQAAAPSAPPREHAPEAPPARRTPAPNFAVDEPPSAPPASPASRPAGASSDRGSFLFDTGGSTFRFADDYVQRITKAFTGAVDEMTLGKDPSPTPAPASVFPHASHDAPAPREGGFSPDEMRHIESIVRAEVQGVVREMVEKVAWEVIPELAEGLIRKQLDQVLKSLEE